jgi:hypothetical protein
VANIQENNLLGCNDAIGMVEVLPEGVYRELSFPRRALTSNERLKSLYALCE